MSPWWWDFTFDAGRQSATLRSDDLARNRCGGVTGQYRTICAISSGDEILLPGDACRISDLNWSDIHPVSVAPGSTALTVMPRPASSALRLIVNASNADFVTTYAICPGIGLWPCPEVMLMMRLGRIRLWLPANSAHSRTDARTFTA